MSNVNVKIAVDYAVACAKVANNGGVIAFPMFHNVTKHDINQVKKGILAAIKVKNLEINKKFMIITLA